MPNQPSEEACQLKGGHPPAVKVGNMRVVQRTHSSSSSHSDKAAEEEKHEGDTPEACSFAPKNLIRKDSSGVPENTVQSVPEAVKHFHEKPQPAHEYRSQGSKPNVIQQPKK